MADVFRHFGPAFRDQHGASLSAARRRAMTAIESCRTAALGGHVERCGDCGHQRVAYNSCRNRNCPKCQGLARAQWLEDRQAELLDVPYFHVVFTVPDADRDHRVPEPDRGLRHPVPGGVGDVAHHRRRPQASGRGDRLPRRAAHLGTEPVRTTRTFIFWFPAAASHRTGKAGSPAGRGSSCRSRCCHGCSGACSCTIWRRHSPPAS